MPRRWRWVKVIFAPVAAARVIGLGVRGRQALGFEYFFEQ